MKEDVLFQIFIKWIIIQKWAINTVHVINKSDFMIISMHHWNINEENDDDCAAEKQYLLICINTI